MKTYESPLSKALFEWFLVVAPVGVYVVSEHMFIPDKRSYSVLYSAEWGIATGFLTIMSIFFLLRDLPRVTVVQPKLGMSRLLAGFLMLNVFAAYAVSIRILELAHGPREPGGPLADLVVWQWGMFSLASAAFVFIKHFLEQCEQRSHASVVRASTSGERPH